ncbi:MAG: FTR1 family protein [Spongiibacteraceae bacterium]
MLLDAIVIVLRETLEAGVLVSVLASLGTRLHLSLRWLGTALLAGSAGALISAFNLGIVSGWFAGVGQEVVDALLQYAIFLLLLWLMLLMQRPQPEPLLRGCMIAIVALAVTREGSEILLFFSSYLQSEEALIGAATSGFVGFMIGLSVGILCYLTLAVTLQPSTAARVQRIVLPLVAAGMTLQATQLLVQADWLPAGPPLWNSGHLLSERSISGQMAYAVFGYEATPTAIEIGFYIGALCLLLLAQYCQRAHLQR